MHLHTIAPTADTHPALRDMLDNLRSAQAAHPMSSLAERRADLEALRQLLREHRDEICDAVSLDYGHRSHHETLMADIFPVVDGITHILKNLRGWMRTRRRQVDMLTYPGARNRVIPQPLGVVGIIVPWNLPVQLSLLPLAYALAAGNRAMLKMSGNSRHLSRLLVRLTEQYLTPNKALIIEDTGGVSRPFAKLPFDHLLFTGSPETGKAVMAAAAQNLCPVTLELGGKSPAILCDDHPVELAADRILFAKCLNAGQTCTSVDHLWLPTQALAPFIDRAKNVVAKRYPILGSPDYTSIIDQRSFNRLVEAMEEARSLGAQLIPLIPGPPIDPSTRKIAPHLVLDAPEHCALWQQEIFGPLLPIRTYTQLDDVIASINRGERPLALYPFSRDKAVVQHILASTLSGGVAVNDALFQVAQHDLPFGGVGQSGMGHYHGHEGFETFSKMRPVFYQTRWSALQLLAPPYAGLANFALKWLID